MRPVRELPTAPGPVTLLRDEVADFQLAAAAVDDTGPLSGSASSLLVDALTRRTRHAATGGDPAAYDDLVAHSRSRLTVLLIGRGVTRDDACARVAALERAHAQLEATPETALTG
jgi:hypothetical protein